MYDLKDYDFNLPDGLIAQLPSPRRDASRLMRLRRTDGALTDWCFHDLPRLLLPGDLLVVNDTRVVPARLYGRKTSGGKIELLILEHNGKTNGGGTVRTCLMKSSKSPRVGGGILLQHGVTGTVVAVEEDGIVKIEFSSAEGLQHLVRKTGQVPLPPYIARNGDRLQAEIDRERYQTVYAAHDGAVAAPTAGLHFTRDLLAELQSAGMDLAALTLHVGHGTFKPVRTSDIRRHELGDEQYDISTETAAAVERTKLAGGRVVAVGTTVVRALESAVQPDGGLKTGPGKTRLLITPGFDFKVVDALITNFHLPCSSLLFLVAAFAGGGLIRKAYNRAVESSYRFYSYGDAMLIV